MGQKQYSNPRSRHGLPKPKTQSNRGVEVANKNVIEVTIAGVPLKLRTGRDPETVKKLVTLVDKMVQDALPATKTGSVQNAALLAALNLAEEMFELKNQALSQLDKIEKKTQKVLSDLETSGASPRAGLDH
ncbi:MAG: cell division protein ZapA [Oligoflexia bacterium]|nr:cell division protein ZapA [Oligoflexia bacterium]